MMAMGGVAVSTLSLQSVSARDGARVETKAVEEAPIPKGGVSIDDIEAMLQKMSIKPTRVQSRLDFVFSLKKPDEWNLSMTTVLSTDNKTLWICAWLDELPKSAADVPRSALLRLLADNDKLGNGQFFSYDAVTKRFLLQRTMKNENIDAKTLKASLVELGETVINTYPHWNTKLWKSGSQPSSDDAGSMTKDAPASAAAGKQAASGEKGARR
jgi:hypothetical protein